jgi:predicted nucleic acid-binding protein
MGIVLVISVLYAGIRSSRGAAWGILELLVARKLTAVLTPALFLEYAAHLCSDPALQALGLTDEDLVAFLDALAALSVRVCIDIWWRPVPPDSDDDMVIECAVNGSADMIIIFNTRDLQPARDRFGIRVLTLAEFLRQFGRGP